MADNPVISASLLEEGSSCKDKGWWPGEMQIE